MSAIPAVSNSTSTPLPLVQQLGKKPAAPPAPTANQPIKKAGGDSDGDGDRDGGGIDKTA